MKCFVLFSFLGIFVKSLEFGSAKFSSVNWIDVVESSADQNTQSPLLPWHFVDFAPCTCDVTPAVCDLRCCCDVHCRNETKDELFACPTQTAKLKLLNDGANDCGVLLPDVLVREPAFIFACKQFETTAYLGHFYRKRAILRRKNEFDGVQGAFASKRAYTYRTALSAEPESLNRPDFKFGSPLLADFGAVSLPQPILSGQCADFTPLRFLESMTDVECLRWMSLKTCTDDALFNVRAFLTPPPKPIEQDQLSIRLFASPTLTSMAVPIRVTYICQSDSAQANDIVDSTREYWFPDWWFQTPVVAQNRCSLPPGHSRPSPPTLTEDNATCTDVVTDVQYTFQWNEKGVAAVLAHVTVKNVTTDDNFVRQRFTVDWERSEEDRISSRTLLTPTSGNPGYETGRPLIAATAEGHEQDVENQQLQISENEQLYLWQTVSDNLCASAAPTRVLFAENSTSSCYVQLTSSAFDDCVSLRLRILDGLQRLFIPTHISRVGSLIALNPDFFVPIFRETLNFTAFDDANTSILRCTDVPTHVALDLFYAETGRQWHTRVYELAAAYSFYNTTTWNFESTRATQQFLLTASVRYYPRPPEVPADVPRYYTRRRRFHCPSHVTCWDDLLFPLLPANIGTDRAYALVMTLASIVAVAGIYWVTKPWAV